MITLMFLSIIILFSISAVMAVTSVMVIFALARFGLIHIEGVTDNPDITVTDFFKLVYKTFI